MLSCIGISIFALLAGTGLSATSKSKPSSTHQVERRLYVTDKYGISVYDIDHGHKLLHRIDVPDSDDYKGIAASAQLGKLYVTSCKKDDLICRDLKTETVVWRKYLGDYADSMAMTPDGKRMYPPFRNEDYWKVVDAATDGKPFRAGKR